jgi:hypothetical protein
MTVDIIMAVVTVVFAGVSAAAIVCGYLDLNPRG